jgi:hypothetical protein
MNRFSRIAAVTVIGVVACSCATQPKNQPRTAVLPASSRIGLACQRLRSAPIPRPETRDQAAGNGLQNGAMAFGDPYGAILGLATVPLFTAIAGAQGVAEKDLHAAIPVIEGAARSSDWLRLFQQHLQHAVREHSGRNLTLAPVASAGLIHPDWKSRYDAVLTVDFRDPSLNGRDGINPLLWAELPVYWTLLDTRTGRALAGGPATGQAPDGHKFLHWAADGGQELRAAFADATRRAAESVATTAFPSPVPAGP